MNREIKFRVWKDYMPGYEYFTLEDVMSSMENDLVRINQSSPQGWEQCTGLKDKNGKDWYEGDKSDIEDCTYGVVIFKEGSFCFDWYELCEHNISEYIETTKMTDYHVESMEIIGNIHEVTK